MKKIIFVILFAIISLGIDAQGYSGDKVAFINFLVRMYNNAPFDGVRAVNDYDNAYLISVLALDSSKYQNNENVINRVASVKAMAQASRFLNGSNITQDTIIHTTEKNDGTSDTEIIENIHENSVGYVKAMEQLTNFKRSDGKLVFIFATLLKNDKPKLQRNEEQ